MDEARITRFWSKVDVRGPDDCWLWKRGRLRGGYGLFATGRKPGQQTLAHRVAWSLSNAADIPRGMHILHSCDNPPCCNPAHLRIGTQLDNVADMIAKGRAGDRPRGEAASRSKLTAAAVVEMRARRAAGTPLAVLAREHAVSEMTAWCVCTGRTWRHVSMMRNC